jgi:hypothetical protein
MNLTKQTIAFLLLTAAAIPGLNAQKIIYVNQLAAGLNNGQSWANAYTDLNKALDASTYNTEVRVAQGTYLPKPQRDSSFNLKNGVRLIGGFAGGVGANPDARDFKLYKTVLSGDIGTPGDSTDNVYNVVKVLGKADNTTRIDGFVIEQGGATTLFPGFLWRNFGGGIYTLANKPFLPSGQGIQPCPDDAALSGYTAKI